jgi:hypothetical protein
MTLRIAFFLALVPWRLVHGQSLIGKPGEIIRLSPQDDAILEGHERRADLTCSVSPIQPQLEFDLSLHSGYEVSVPMEELAGKGNVLTAIFRVMSAGESDNKAYFHQKWIIPEVAEGTKGTAHLKGGFVLGEGKYQVDWLMRDRDERSCSARWQIRATPHKKDKPIELRVPPGSAAEAPHPFVRETPVKRERGNGLNVVVMLHVASPNPGAATMATDEIPPVMSILRNIAREPRISSYSVMAFNLERRQVLFRSERSAEVDFPALGEAIGNVQLNTIDVKRLREYSSEPYFLGKLLAEEMGQSRPDAVIFVGPKTTPEFAMRGALKSLAGPRCPVFYLTYIADPISNPWKDLIGSAVKLWKGLEYTITRPRDLFTAWNDVMSRIPIQDTLSDTGETVNGFGSQKITSASDVKHR